MKINKLFIALGCLALVAATSCKDDEEWTPGPDYGTTNQVSMTDGASASIDAEIDAGKEAVYTVNFTRANDKGQITVPLTVTADDVFEVPSSVTFADGSSTASIEVKFKGTEAGGKYRCSITIPNGEYNSPYTSLYTAANIDVLVAVWDLVSESARFYSWDSATQMSNVPEFNAAIYKLHLDEGQMADKEKGYVDMYRVINFMEDYNLTFYTSPIPENIGVGYFIYPTGGCYGPICYDWGSNYSTVWYFAPGIQDDGYPESYPLHFNNMPGYYMDYCFILVGMAGSSFTSYIVPDQNYGLIFWDYSRYSDNGDYVDGKYDHLWFQW